MLATLAPIVAFATAASAAVPAPQDTSAFCAGVPTGDPFPDVTDPSDPHYANIACAKDGGIVQGKTDGLYHPNDNTSRAQMASLVAREADLAVSLAAPGQTLTPLPAAGSNPFVDVGDPPSSGSPSTAPHTDNILRLNAADITNGTDATHYSPANPITRFQMAKFEVLKLEFITGTTLDDTCGATFPDGAETDATFGPFVTKAACAGIIQGKADGSFHGGDTLTRAQTATFEIRGMAYLLAQGFITPLHGTPSTNAYQIDPSSPALLTASTAPGTANGNQAARTFTVSGIPTSDSPVDVALIPSTSVNIDSSGNVTFRDTDIGVDQAGRADQLGGTGCRIDSINGVSRGVADGTPGVFTDNSDYANNIAVTNGTLTVTTNCQTPNQAFYLIVFKDADNNNQLNLDNTDPNATFKPATESFGISGVNLVIPAEAAFGTTNDRMAIALGIVSLFTTPGPPLGAGPAQTFFVQDGDDLRYKSGPAFPAPGQVLSKSQFFDYASGIVTGQREDIGGYPDRLQVANTPSSNDSIVFGDGFSANYVPQAQTGNSAIAITDDVPAAVTEVTATAADTDANGSQDDVAVAFPRPINPDINHFDIWRGTVNTGNGLIPTTPPGNFTLVGSVPATAGQTSFTFNDQNHAVLTAQPGLKFGYIVLAVNGNGSAGPDSNTAMVTMPTVTNTRTPAIASSQFTNGTNVGNNPATVDAQDAFQLTLVNGPVTVAANATLDLRDDDGDLFRVTCGTNATCGVSGATSNIVTAQMTGNAQLIQTGTGGSGVNGTLDAPINPSFVEIVAATGISNANGALNLAESGLGGAGGSPVDAGLTQPPATRIRIFGGNTGTNSPLPDAPSNAVGDVTADPANDRVTVGNGVVGPANGDTLNLYNGAGVLIGTATENHASPGGTVINASPGFAAGDRLYLTYTQATNPKLESETLRVFNPTDKPTVVSVTGSGTSLVLAMSESVTQTGPASNYQVFDQANSTLIATGTSVTGSPCPANPNPCNLTVTFDNPLIAGTSYNLRVAANTVQDVNNLPNDAQVVPFTAANQNPTITVVTGPNGVTTTQNQPTWTGTAQAFQGRTISGTGIAASVDGGGFSTTGVTVTSGAGTANVSWSFTPAAPLSDAAHTVQFRVTDSGALTGTTAVIPFTVNAVAPTVTSIVTLPGNSPAGPDIRITFSEAVDCNGSANDGALTGDAFSYTDSSNPGSGNTVAGHANDSFAANSTATISAGPLTTQCDIDAPSVFLDGEDFGTLSYAQPAAAVNRIVDTGGTPVASFNNATVNDGSAPTILTVTGTAGAPGTITVNMSGGGTLPAGEAVLCTQLQASDFSVTVNGTPAVVNTVTCGGATASDTFTLTLAVPLVAGNTVTVTANANSVANQQNTNFLSGSGSDTV